MGDTIQRNCILNIVCKLVWARAGLLWTLMLLEHVNGACYGCKSIQYDFHSRKACLAYKNTRGVLSTPHSVSVQRRMFADVDN